MGARKIKVSVECCDTETGEMQITVDDPGNPEDEWVCQDMVLHPAVCHLLYELLGDYVRDGKSMMSSVSLNSGGSVMTAPGRPRLSPRPESHDRIEQVPCPRCGAMAGQPCRSPAGGPGYVPHQARRDAAADAGKYVPR